VPFGPEVHSSAGDFHTLLDSLQYNFCSVCMRVKMNMPMSRNPGITVCTRCHGKKLHGKSLERGDFCHPVWYNESGIPQYDLPEELEDLTEGEKLLIQQVSPYVPLQHLQNGSYGSKGHVCSFPQDIHEVCTKLPRLPSSVNTIRIVKQYVDDDGQPQKVKFNIRRNKVLNALKWLKKHNTEYAHIEIHEEHLDWMTLDTATYTNSTY